MNFETMADKLKNGMYGDQGISTSTASDYIWTNLLMYVLDPLGSRMYVNKFTRGALVVDSTQSGVYDEQIDFPSVSYIPDELDYVVTSEKNLTGEIIVNAGRRTTVPLFSTIMAHEETLVKAFYDITFKTEKNGEWNYKVLVDFQEGEDDISERPKVVKIYPRVIKDSTSRKASEYVTDLSEIQFFDVEEDDDRAINLYAVLPPFMGDTWTISVTIVDYNEVEPDTGELDEAVTEIFESLVMGLKTDSPYFVNENLDPDINPGYIDYTEQTLILPEFEIFVMEDGDVDKMLTYIVTIHNWTSDEADTGSQQKTALQEFNTNIKGYPSNVFFDIIPDEFKLTSEEIQAKNNNNNNKWSTRTRLFNNRY